MARRSRWIYGSGSEPDYRFSLANERTLLAWLRTCLALMAGGVAINTVDVGIRGLEAIVLARVLLLLGCLSAVAAWWRWALAERAMRHRRPLPAAPLLLVVSSVVALVAVVVVVSLEQHR